MKRLLNFYLFLFIITSTPTITGQVKEQESRAAIEKILINSYVEGVLKNFNEEAVRTGFHEDFHFHAPMMTQDGRVLKKFDLNSWVNMLKNMSFDNIEYKLLNVSVTDNAAATVNEIYQDGKKLYTDYMIWQNIDGNWKIMGKVFAYHQKRMKRQ